MATPPRIPPIIGSRPGPPPIPRPPPLKALAGRVQALRSAPAPVAGPAILSPQELDRFKDLLVFAKSTVEGYFSGKHKSPYRGSSAEFAEYREYSAGDDVARLDWRVYGRSRRLFIRQYEEETDMVVYLLVDTSASMSYCGAKRPSKYLLAAKIAAALSYLMIHQGDKAALALFSDTVNHYLPPGGTRAHLHNLVRELERVKPASTTGMLKALTECASLVRKRGRIVLLSDLLTDTEELFDALGQFMHRKFDILLLQIMDPDELDLPPLNTAKFEDLETSERVQIELEEIRPEYRRAMRAFIDAIAREADRRQIHYSLIDTRRPYLQAIETYLGFRGKLTRFAA